ncbi:NUDIX domain-containing protein [Streptomyces murinus]|uniref:ADP-ribose pyrophosphatase YjhB (NUDIX family) n=1 Tax=Streptomyces murinus TaxID=33900 RepID=A0A7W3NK51_STRMR|nr:NUDIX domain-containing protein [Streptomyces murinus]MBA9051993.1 ADP-ribose pyrophosphatase YjhB (NUDIX family) [Streptomyces murinus]UWW93276.1 NUDIX domain-containing protein [Streptomyces murinus]
MALVRLRRSVRAIVLDEGDRVLLCRFLLPKPTGPIVVWAAPGGGVERGESVLAALQRELREIAGYRGTDLFSPRDLATPLAALIDGRAPGAVVRLGL